MKHKCKNEIKLGDNEEFTEDVYHWNKKCPKCGGILVTQLGPGISHTYDYD